MKAIFSAMFVLILFTAAQAAEAKLYLYPRVEGGQNGISISDIAKVDADADTAARIGGIGIAGELYADGYLDRKEIIGIIKERVDGRINVYGSGVRIVKRDLPAASDEPRIIVKKGSPVRFQVVNACIRVEQTGTAMQDGAAGDVIQVKLKGAAVSRGVILNERTVELIL
jgi:hypothetical protein